ncbi:nodal modulator 1, partial [Tanacetum coccineum]
EYAFSPAAQAVELDSREAKKVLFQATRVAYRGFAAITYALLFCPLLLQQEMSQVTIYGSDLLILLAYAPSMPPLLSLPLPMACDDSDGVGEAMMSLLVGRNRGKAVCILAWQLTKVAAMADVFLLRLPRSRSQNGAMGVVTLLSGQPKEGISIEARSDLKGSYEETLTDSSGSYLLRGLHPNTSYTIRVVPFSNASGPISRTLFCQDGDHTMTSFNTSNIKELDGSFAVPTQPINSLRHDMRDAAKSDYKHGDLRWNSDVPLLTLNGTNTEVNEGRKFVNCGRWCWKIVTIVDVLGSVAYVSQATKSMF